MASGGASEDDGLPDYRRLNATFYSGDPAAYFERRLGLLLLAAARRDEVDALLAEGVTFGGVTFRPTRAADPERAADDESVLLAESLVLLHHASEALLRLFIAHVEYETCPWIAAAGLTNFKDFKGIVGTLAQEQWPDWLESRIHFVFLGRPSSHDDPELAALRAPLKELLTFLAGEVLEDAPVYNAAKHGMAVVPGVRTTSLEDPAGGFGIFTDGPSLLFLQTAWTGTWKNKERTYSEVVRWMTPARNLWLTQVVIQQLRALWTVARARYAGGTVMQVDVVDPGWMDEMWNEGNGPAGGFHRVAHVVATEARLPQGQ